MDQHFSQQRWEPNQECLGGKPFSTPTVEELQSTTLPLDGGVDGKSPIFVKNDEEVGYYVCVMHGMKEFWAPDTDK